MATWFVLWLALSPASFWKHFSFDKVATQTSSEPPLPTEPPLMPTPRPLALTQRSTAPAPRSAPPTPTPTRAPTPPPKLCAAGLHMYRRVDGSASCAQCPPGRFNGNPSDQTACTQCFAGMATVRWGAKACAPCPRGRWQPQEGAVMCTMKGALREAARRARCPTGKFFIDAGAKIGTASTQGAPRRGACQLCPRGFLCVGSGDLAPCAAGRFANRVGSAGCSSCPRGKLASGVGSARCSRCPQGRRPTGQSGATACDPCPPGRGGPVAAGTATAPSQGRKRTYCPLCPAGRMAAHAGSEVCAACAGGRFSNKRGAQACAACPAGKFSLPALQQAVNRGCVPCPRGRSTFGLTKQAACVCTQGRFARGRVSSTAACELCPAGRFDSRQKKQMHQSASCTGQCREGYFCPEGSTNATQFECGDAGSFCPAGSGKPQRVVRDGSYAAGGTSETTHTHAALCAAGSACRDGIASLCAPGRYQSQRGMGSCVACPVGQYQPRRGEVAGCNHCAPGGRALRWTKNGLLQRATTELRRASRLERSAYLSHHDAHELDKGLGAISCTLCPAGRFRPDDASRTATADELSTSTTRLFWDWVRQQTGHLGLRFQGCAPCLNGATDRRIGATRCSKCAVGRVLAANGTQCSECPPGQIQHQKSCHHCPAGKWVATTRGEVSACETCISGKFQDPSEGCVDCPVGRVSAMDGATRCEPCKPGQAAGVGQQQCIMCAPGRYSVRFGSQSANNSSSALNTGMTVLLNSAGGEGCAARCKQNYVIKAIRMVMGMATTTCVACPAGRYSDGFHAGRDSCTPCPPGKHATVSLAFGRTEVACQACPVGRDALSGLAAGGHVDDTSPCGHVCPAGQHAAGFGLPCTACEPGQYSTLRGSRVCLPCGRGRVAARVGSMVCAHCPPSKHAAGSTSSAHVGENGAPQVLLRTRCDTCSAGMSPDKAAEQCVVNTSSAAYVAIHAAMMRARRPCECAVDLVDEARIAAVSGWCYLSAVPCTLRNGAVHRVNTLVTKGLMRPWAFCSTMRSCPHFGNGPHGLTMPNVQRLVDAGTGKPYYLNTVTGRRSYNASAVLQVHAVAPPLPRLGPHGCTGWAGSHLGDWSYCNRRCGGGMQVRARVVVRCGASGGVEGSTVHSFQQRRLCQTQPCRENMQQDARLTVEIPAVLLPVELEKYVRHVGDRYN